MLMKITPFYFKDTELWALSVFPPKKIIDTFFEICFF